MKKSELEQLIKEEITNSLKVNESSLNRIYSHILQHDCAVITAFRKKLNNCISKNSWSISELLLLPGDEAKDDSEEVVLNTSQNKKRNQELKSTLLKLGYSVTSVKGTYIEDYMSENAIEVKEDSYFVVNIKDDPQFKNNIANLGKNYCQDSVIIIEKGGNNNILYGTNYNSFPGAKKKYQLGKFKPGVESEFMTKVGNRPFTLESYDSLQINSKRIVTELSRHIVSLLKKS